MVTKNFKTKFNQNLWDQYNNLMLKQNRNQASINQYKPSVLALEEATNKELKDITAEELNNYINSNIIKNTGHVRGFIISCVNSDLLTVNKDVVTYLIPVEYKKLVKCLMV